MTQQAEDSQVLIHLLQMAEDIQAVPLSLDTNLVEAGFDSLASLELATRIEDELAVPCTIDDILDTPTLRGLGALVTAREQGLPGW